MVQVQVRVKFGDQVVALVQFRHFPWEPGNFPGDRGKRAQVSMDPRKALTILGLASPRDLLEGRGSPREPEKE